MKPWKFPMVVITLALAGAARLFSQSMEVPADLQFALFPKILGYDRNLQNRVGNEIVFAILYQGHYDASVHIKESIENIMDRVTTIEKIPTRYVFIDLEQIDDLGQALKDNEADVVYLTILRNFDFAGLNKICRERKILTLTGVEDYVYNGIAVGIGVRNTRPLPIINLEVARLTGIDFNSKLLSLSKIVN